MPSVCASLLRGASRRAGLDDLELLEEGHDPLVPVALVDDDLARLAGLGRLHRDDLLAGAGRPRPGRRSTPRSATFSSSTGLPLAAMMPLNDGYRGSTTPAVTVMRAGSGTSTSS